MKPISKLGPDLVAHRTRNTNSAGLGYRLQAGGDVDRIAEQVYPFDDHVADMNTDAEPHRFARRAALILLADNLLHSDGALHRINCAGEVGNDAVAGSVDDPPAMRRDQSVHDGAVRLEPIQGADLVLPHQLAVARDVGREDRCEFSFDRLDRHLRLLPEEYSASDSITGMLAKCPSPRPSPREPPANVERGNRRAGDGGRGAASDGSRVSYAFIDPHTTPASRKPAMSCAA